MPSGGAPNWKGKDPGATKDTGAPVVVDGGGPVLFAWVTEECNRISGRGLMEEEERVFASLVRGTSSRSPHLWNVAP